MVKKEKAKNSQNREFRSPIYGVSSIALSFELKQTVLIGYLGLS